MKKKLMVFVCVLGLLISVLSGCNTPEETSSNSPSTASEAEVGSSEEAGSSEAVESEDVSAGSGVSEVSSQGGQAVVSKPATSQSTASTTSKTEKPPENYDITTAPMPTRKLTNKTIKYFYWADLETDPKAWTSLMKKEFGVNFAVTKASFANYWDSLGLLIRSGKSPDIVEVPGWDFYREVPQGLLEPLDDILDLNNGLWNETRSIMEKYRWKGKTYLTFYKNEMYSWFYYNEKMFKNYGISKTPKDYFLEDNWTLDTLKQLADQFVDVKGGKVNTYGLAVQNFNLQAITGVDLVTIDSKGNLSLNMKNAKIEKLMNWMHTMGKAGSNAIQLIDPIGDFANQKVPMLITVSNLFVDTRSAKIRNDIKWVPMPKLDKSSPYYLEMAIDPGCAIVKGATNKEAAALALEYRRWLYLGRTQITDFLEPKQNAAVKKYKLRVQSNYDLLTNEERQWTKELLAKYKYSYADTAWSSWVNTNGLWSAYPGMTSIINEGKAWSAVLSEEFKILESLLKATYS